MSNRSVYMTEENPNPQEQAGEVTAVQDEPAVVEEVQKEVVPEQETQEESEKSVPLSALQKERKKRQSLQEKVDYYESLQKQTPQEEDYGKYESVTQEELGQRERKLERKIHEKSWSKEFPDRASYVASELEEFLTKRPNLALAIENSENRLEEAWELMTKLAPSKTKAVQQVTKRDAPQAPGTVPKAAALNEVVDVMGMSDAEFRDYRNSKRKRR